MFRVTRGRRPSGEVLLMPDLIRRPMEAPPSTGLEVIEDIYKD